MQLMRLHLPKKSDFSSPLSFYLWRLFAFLLVPLTLHPRLYDLANPLVEPHPWRQNQTALTAYYFHKGLGTVFDYRSPYDGRLWNYVIEFPLYQWLVAKAMSLGFSLEVSGKLLSLLFFFIGGIFLFRTVTKLTTKETGLWTVVLYYVSFFNIVYSRTVLIDLMAQCFCLASAYYLVRLQLEGGKGKDFFLSILFGILGATGKITVWFSLALTVFFYLSYSILREKERIQKSKLLISSIVIQAFVAVGWMKWSSYVLGLTGDFNSPRWFFGELPIRLDGWRWATIFRTIGRSVLSDFMLLPFLFAFSTQGKKRDSCLILLAVIFIPILILFNIHVHHDYYFITETPYIFILAGIGMVSLFQKHKSVVVLSLCLMAVAFGRRMKNFDSTLGIIYHDFRPNIAEILTLKKMTQPSELIYYHSDYIGRLEIPFYSERSVILGPSRFFGKGVSGAVALSPTVFWIRTNAGYDKLDAYETLSLHTDPSGFYLLRSMQPDNKKIEPSQFVSVSQIPDSSAQPVTWESKTLDFCSTKSQYTAYKLPENTRRIELFSELTKTSYVLPGKSYLYLPTANDIGCRLTVSLKK